MTNWQLLNAQAELERRRQQAGVSVTPHAASSADWLQSLKAQPSPVEPSRQVKTPGGLALPGSAPVSHFPDVGLAAMRRGCDAHYRVWLAARHLDSDGRGCLPLPYLYEHLTSGGDCHLFLAPRLRSILADGDGFFWRIQNGRLWLTNSVKLAQSLDLRHFTRTTADMPLSVLTAGVARFRAEIFAAWLLGRIENNPISQGCLQSLTGVASRTQRRYLALAGVQAHQNIAVGPVYNPDTAQDAAWQHGNVFQFTDFKGKLGAPGRSYVAWHLPRSYSRRRTARPSLLKKRRLNKALNGLTISEALGNITAKLSRRFFLNGKHLAKHLVGGEDFYLKNSRAKTGTGIWSAITIS